MSRLLGTLLVSAALLAAAAPATAVSTPIAGASGLTFWIQSDGASVMSREGELDTQATQACSAIAPLTNACVAQGTSTFPYGGSWRAGINFPSLGQPPTGAFLGSVVLNLSGSKTYRCGGSPWGCGLYDEPSSFEVLCNITLVNVFGLLFGDVNCGQISFPAGTPTGEMAASFHAGALDGRVPPYGLFTRNTQEYAVGNFGGFLTAT